MSAPQQKQPDASELTFDGACDLIGAALKGPTRSEIVTGLLASRTSSKPLPRLRYFMRSHIFKSESGQVSLARVVKKFDASARQDGFNVLHDWDGKAEVFNKEIIPVDVLNFLMATHDPGDSERQALAILLDYYFFYILSLVSLRAWDEGRGNEHLDRVNQLLADLQGPDGSGQQFADNAETLALIATSHFEGEEASYERLLEKMRSLNQAHQTDAALVYAGILASHLRFGLQTTYGRDIGKMREDNVPDYPWLCFALSTLMKTYSRLHAEGVTGTKRDKIVEGIVNGLSPDAGAFLDDPPSFLAAYEEERSKFRDGLRRHREDLLEEFKQHQPSEKVYSPIAFFFNFPHNLLKGAVVDALFRGKPWRVSINDLLTRFSQPPGESQEVLAKTLMGYARRSPGMIRGRLVPAIVYDPGAGRRDYVNAIDTIEGREPSGG